MIEEMRHGWQMCALLVDHFGYSGKVEAQKMLERRAFENQRLLGAFNVDVDNWMDFFTYTDFVDRDGKFQLQMLKYSAFAPLGRSMSFEEAVVAAIDFHGALSGTGSYAPPIEARGGKHKGAGVGPSPAYSYSAQVAEVSVDEETGEVTVHKVWAAHDCGRALNPVSVEGQVIGSVWMGMGQALTEEMIWKDGMVVRKR